MFWSPVERREHKVWDFNLNDVNEFLYKHKYEIENNLSPVDWLKMYAEAIEEYDMDMNILVQEVTKETGKPFDGNQGLPQEDWLHLAKEARALSDFAITLSEFKQDMDVDLESFMATHEPIKKASEASIYQKAINYKNEKIGAVSGDVKVDRVQNIRNDLT